MLIEKTKRNKENTVKNKHIGTIKVTSAKREELTRSNRTLEAAIEIMLDSPNVFIQQTGIVMPTEMNEYISKYFFPYLSFNYWSENNFDDYYFYSETLKGIEDSRSYSLKNIIDILRNFFSSDVLNNLFLKEEEKTFVKILSEFIMPYLKAKKDFLKFSDDYFQGLQIGIYFSYKHWQNLVSKESHE